MPAARGIICSLKIEGRDSSVPEYDPRSEEDFASAFVVAEGDRRFSLEVVATKWIHPDWCLFIYIDGVYQCGHTWNALTPKHFPLKADFSCKRERESGVHNISFRKAWRFDKLSAGTDIQHSAVVQCPYPDCSIHLLTTFFSG